MRKFLLVSMIFSLLFLSACGSDEDVYNFRSRKDDYFISENDRIIIDYKTDENGKMIEFEIDRFLTIAEMIYFNTTIDYDMEVDGFTDDIFVIAGYECTDYDDFRVPANIEIGTTRYKYNRIDCQYQEVDRDNIYKSGTYARYYNIEETIPVSTSIKISMVVYIPNAPEKFVEVQYLPHTAKLLGVYSIPLNSDKDGFTAAGVFNYYTDMAIYEQLYLKHQKNEITVNEINGIPEDISLLDFDSIGDISPLISDFLFMYSEEIQAVDELEQDIALFIDTEGETNEEE